MAAACITAAQHMQQAHRSACSLLLIAVVQAVGLLVANEYGYFLGCYFALPCSEGLQLPLPAALKHSNEDRASGTSQRKVPRVGAHSVCVVGNAGEHE